MTDSTPRQIVVVGGGMAGHAAALEAVAHGASVTLLEKEPRLGGNSAKASSGINAFGTAAQAAGAVEDGYELFYADTDKSGRGHCDAALVEHLVASSPRAVEFLSEWGVDLSVLSQCGGHSAPRTHRAGPRADGKPSNVGWDIMKVMIGKMKELEESGRVRVVNGALVSELVVDGEGAVTGVRYANGEGNSVMLTADAVVLASGGFGANQDMLARYAPAVRGLPTTNGPFAQGQGMQMGQAAGGALVQMEHVQVHPSGIVDPAKPDAMSKFLAPESMRACGGVLLRADGTRFCNELGRRDEVTAAIQSNGWQVGEHTHAFLVLNEDAVECFQRPMFNFYKNVKKFVRTYDNAEALAAGEGMADAAVLAETLRRAGTADDEFGRALAVPIDPSGTLHVLTITPSIHYTMGGLRFNEHAQVLRSDGTPVCGLYAAGEVTGGLHGANRLAGNSLLDCVVYGRTAGRVAARGGPSFFDWTELSMKQFVLGGVALLVSVVVLGSVGAAVASVFSGNKPKAQ